MNGKAFQSSDWSTSGVPVSDDDHARWFASVVNNPAHRVRIGEVDGEPVGFVRVDVTEGIGTVSVAVAAEARGRGYGRDLLETVLADVHQDCQVRELAALVHPHNEASMRAFRAAGFVIASSGVGRGLSDDPSPFVRLARAA